MSALIELRIPHMGSVENAKIVEWLVAEGDSFKAGQGLYEMETDKTVTTVEAESDGVLARRLAKQDEELKVGDLVAYAAAPGSDGDTIATALEALSAPKPAVTSTHTAAPESLAGAAPASGGPVKLSPLVRRLAAELGVDASALIGTGSGGKITPEDVRAAAGKRGSEETSGGVPRIPGYKNIPVEAVANSARRRAISRRLLESARNSATLTADMQIDLSALLRERAALNQSRKAKNEIAVSVLPFVAHAVCRVLRAKPEFNATYTESHYLLWKSINLGIAVDTPDGLVVPVIRDADRLSVIELDAAIRDLAARMREGSVGQTEMEEGTFTISNPGSLGPVLRAEAVLNPPQVALLGLPAMLHVPVAVGDGQGGHRVEVRPVIRPSLTFDHRALDGGQVIGFLNELRTLLEAASID